MQTAAHAFLKQRQYGVAVSFYLSAEDYAGIGHAANALLSEFILWGGSYG
jgi:nuclear pore complex protein Nup85